MSAVVEVQISADRYEGLGHAVVAFEINLLVFDAAPQPLDEDVVASRALVIHADRNAVLDRHAGERGTRELRALAGVEDLRPAVRR